ncbi:MAG TPA: BTAD domain-containing putative transcriptional regulator [Streptosporangiaceae bacterium]|nr:BTAD domain-containing putative transcriptional regulator [Streptosporangiaceae bacterium]
MISAPRLRTVLAALLLRANQPVPVDELADLVWNGAPPAEARDAVRALVMRLRRRLDQQAAARVVTRAPGYAIEVSSEELDASRFERLTRQADDAIRAGRWANAAPVAAGALSLWRSTPLVDVPSDLLRDQWVPALEQLYLRALTCRIEADLHEGRHEQLIPQLHELTARHPLRENFYGQLMLALVRSGRWAEALGVYQQASQELATELGVDPGPELRRLHERVLAGDASLTALPVPAEEDQAGAAQLTAVQSAPALRQLPASVQSFVGRQSEVSRLGDLVRQALDPAGAAGTVIISAIDGMAGVGKTALAVHAAHQLAGRFPDGQLFLDMHGWTQGHEPRAAGEALEVLLRALGVPPQRVPPGTDERAAMFRQRLAGTETLIVLDNVASEAQVRPLLPGSAGCLVLVTSRRRLRALDEAHLLSLDVLPRADAVELFRAVAGPGRVPADDPALAEVVELCDRLPLAVRIAAALLRHRSAWTLEHLAGLLHSHSTRISALSDRERNLSAIFDLSYRSLTEAEQSTFRCLGLVPGPDFDAYATATLTGDAPAVAASVLEDLVDHNLVLQRVAGRYRLHDLIRLHARVLADRDPAVAPDAALDRLMDYYQHTADRADVLISPIPRLAPASPGAACAPALPDADTSRAWLRAERPNLLAALRYATSHARPERAITLTAGLATLLRDDGPWPEALALHTDAIAAACSLGDLAGQAAALTQLGIIRNLAGDCPGALGDLEQAAQLCRELDDSLGRANALTQLGDIRGFVDDWPGAVDDLEQALRLYQLLGNRLGQANALARLGNIRRYTGDYPGAIPGLQEALRLYQRLGDRTGQGKMLISLGNAQRVTGDFAGAARRLEEALRLNGHLGHQLGRANSLSELGELRRLTGDLPAAARYLEQGLQIFQDLGNRMGQANAQVWLGSVRQATGDLAGASQLLEAAMDTFRRIGSRGSEAWALNRYAAVISATGDPARAEALYLEALRLARETRQLDDEAFALEGSGEHLLRRADTEAGVAHLQQALEIFQRMAMQPDADRVQTRLAHVSNP